MEIDTVLPANPPYNAPLPVVEVDTSLGQHIHSIDVDQIGLARIMHSAGANDEFIGATSIRFRNSSHFGTNGSIAGNYSKSEGINIFLSSSIEAANTIFELDGRFTEVSLALNTFISEVLAHEIGHRLDDQAGNLQTRYRLEIVRPAVGYIGKKVMQSFTGRKRSLEASHYLYINHPAEKNVPLHSK